jgi:hypothetical protein
MPETAAELGVDPDDPIQNIQGGLRYLRQQLDRHEWNVALALASYNAGPAAADHAGGRIPDFPETQQYVQAILGRLDQAVEQRRAAQIGTPPPGAAASSPSCSPRNSAASAPRRPGQ